MAGSERGGSAPEPQGEDNEWFRQIVVQVEGFAIFMLDPSGHNRTWNEGVERLVGYTETEWIGQHASHLFTPEDRAAGEPERELQTAAEQGQASDDRWLLRKDGSRFFATGITTGLRDPQGRLVGFSKVFRDRTEERKAQENLADREAKLRVALRAGRMGIWQFHIPAGTQRLDHSMGPLLGLDETERSESLDQFLSRAHPEDRARLGAALRHAADTGGDLDVEFRVIQSDGAVRWLSGHGRVSRGPDGAPEYLTGAAVDVTERKTAETKLVQAQRMDAAGQLAGGVAHEVNNMMQAVLGYTALLIAGLDRRKADRADLLNIQRAAERASAITSQLLAFSRRQVIHPQLLSVNEVVREMEPIIRRTLGVDRTLTFDLANRLAAVWADRGSLEQVVLNLALNARDAMPDGGTLTIATRGADISDIREAQQGLASGRYTVLSLSDTGHGMDETTRARAFEPFFTTKPVGQGTGLGLPMVQGIVEQSDGSVRLASAPGQGTTVELYFPAAGEAPSRGESAAGAARLPGGSGIVLVAEDEDLVRDLVCRSLTELGYTCWPAASGSEALSRVAAEARRPDLLITDLVMPGASGRALADRLRQDRPDLPVLFISAYSADEVLRRGLLTPDATYLQKPFALEALAAAVNRLLGRRSSPTGAAAT